MRHIITKVLATIMIITIVGTVAPVGAAESDTPSINEIKKQSKIALREVLSYQKNTKKSAYVDLTGDGVKDLFIKGTVYTYNYKLKSVRKIQLMYDNRVQLKKFSKMYISKKKKRIYFKMKDSKCYGEDHYTKYYYGLIYKMNDIRKAYNEDGVYTAFENRYIAREKEPEYFVPKKKYKKGADYYIINYSWNDQDDAWYSPYRFKKIKKYIKKKLPGKKKVKLKNKVTI